MYEVKVWDFISFLMQATQKGNNTHWTCSWLAIAMATTLSTLLFADPVVFFGGGEEAADESWTPVKISE